MPTVIGKAKCGACNSAGEVREGKSGTLSIYCLNPKCKSTTMVKSPSAVAALRELLGGAPGDAAASSGGASASSMSDGAKMDRFLRGERD